jgi:protein-glutamine gamma-glutamyltransferase
MIRIAGSPLQPYELMDKYPSGSIEGKIISKMSLSSSTYEYSSLEQLVFELDLRKNIISASRELNRSGLSFRVFRKAICNTDYWTRTAQGGFLLKKDVRPSAAVRDIFTNGHLYGTECATAIVIVYYKAVLNVFPAELFDKTFPTIHLMNWHYMDRDLGVRSYDRVPDFLPGDCLYVKNPDVNPLTPEWQGENAIDLGDGTFYGHGMGIKTIDQIIKALNSQRRRGSTRSAYLLESATRPNFKRLASIYYSYTTGTLTRNYLLDWTRYTGCSHPQQYLGGYR